MRKKLQRGLCVLLCVVMAFSCAVVPAGAVVVSPAIVSVAKAIGLAVGEWLVGAVVDETLQKFKDWIDGKSTDTDGYITHIGALRTAQKTEVTEERLRELAYEWNTTCSDAVGFTVDVVDHRLDTGEVYCIIAVRRGYVVTTDAVQYCLADGISRILYCDATTELSGRWVPEADTRGRHLLNYNDLFNLSQDVGGLLRLKDGFYEIYKRDGTVYCNVSGRRFSCIYKADQAAINQDRPTTGGTWIEGDTVTNIENNDNSVTNNDYSQDIDIEDMTQVLPGGTQNVIDNLIYDDNTKTYYIDSHDTTYNVTNNYSYQYHINYTSITYIGQTEEYAGERYELYYQLPDGRDSADLTLEELEQLNVDIDVIPYVRYADNMDVRSLYHFDGDTRDSSYWNYCTGFGWINGASLTYMESGAFEGALYLDENAHEFQLTLPQATDAVGDWTLQWRYYQSHTAAPVNDSSVYVGDQTVLSMDGSKLYTPAGDQITVIPTGSWNEICIIRSGGSLYYYVNGVYYTSADDVSYRDGSVRFVFGDQQQTYKHLDELRFTRGAVYTPGQNYTPTSVPHDSNLTLVLPSGSDVVVDEISTLVPGEGNLLTAYGRDDWRLKECGPAYFEGNATPYYEWSEYFDTSTSDRVPVHTSGYPIIFDSDYVSGTILAKRGRNIDFRGTAFSCVSSKSDLYRQPRNSFSLPLFVTREADSSAYSSYLVGDWQKDIVYTYSVVLDDHSFSSVTFRISSCAAPYSYNPEHNHFCSSGSVYLEILNVVQNSEIQFSFEKLGVVDQGWSYDDEDNYSPVYDYIYPATALCWNSVDGSAVVQYTELVVGEQPAFDIKYETAVYTSGELEHSPTLAVRTDIDITDHQIGGVRPSVPEKGHVWALVESGYITSLQVYNGSLWENCDGRIWTGQRWIPASSYNVITLQDMFDIVDSTTDYEYIYTESGFWSWFQKAWKDLISRLDQIIEGQISGQYDPSKYECQHVYDRTVDCAATCTDYGRHVFFCTECGDTVEVLLDPIGHDWPLDLTAFSIYRQPQSVTAPVGSTATFRVLATGEGLQYQWAYKQPGYNWAVSPAAGARTNTLSIPVTQNRDGYQYRCKITDSSGAVLYSDAVTLTVGAAVEPVPSEGLTCTRCGAAGEYDGERIIGPDGAPDEDLRVDVILLDVFNGAWSIVTGFISTGFNGLSGFVNSLSSIPSFFDLYRPGNSAGVLGLFNYGGDDIWD